MSSKKSTSPSMSPSRSFAAPETLMRLPSQNPHSKLSSFGGKMLAKGETITQKSVGEFGKYMKRTKAQSRSKTNKKNSAREFLNDESDDENSDGLDSLGQEGIEDI